jgi:hypothetical protein
MGTKKRFFSILWVAVLFATLVLNVLAFLPQKVSASGGSYDWVYIANNVWHCDTTTTSHCSPQSAHHWENTR